LPSLLVTVDQEMCRSQPCLHFVCLSSYLHAQFAIPSFFQYCNITRLLV